MQYIVLLYSDFTLHSQFAHKRLLYSVLFHRFILSDYTIEYIGIVGLMNTIYCLEYFAIYCKYNLLVHIPGWNKDKNIEEATCLMNSVCMLMWGPLGVVVLNTHINACGHASMEILQT
jgi:hypothetical protein